MKAYLVLDFKIHDLRAFKQYIDNVPAFIAKHGGKYLVQGAEPTPLEGDWRPERMVVLEFPARQNATDFLNDPEFRDLLAVRHRTTPAVWYWLTAADGGWVESGFLLFKPGPTKTVEIVLAVLRQSHRQLARNPLQ